MCRMTFPNITEEMKTLRSERGTDSPGPETGGRAKAGRPGSSEHGCQPQGSCLQGDPQPREAHRKTPPDNWMGHCLQARERLWAFPGQVVSKGL